jgi:hypothetical protein
MKHIMKYVYRIILDFQNTLFKKITLKNFILILIQRTVYSRVVVGKKNIPTVAHTGRKRRPKWVPSALGYNWATLSLGVINTEAWSSRLGVGRGANNHTP